MHTSKIINGTMKTDVDYKKNSCEYTLHAVYFKIVNSSLLYKTITLFFSSEPVSFDLSLDNLKFSPLLRQF